MSMITRYDALSPTEAERVRQFDPDALSDWLDQPQDQLSFVIDKAWHAVHFTLTDDPWDTSGPLGDVVLGGEEFGEDMGYGPLRWLTPGRVARWPVA